MSATFSSNRSILPLILLALLLTAGSSAVALEYRHSLAIDRDQLSFGERAGYDVVGIRDGSFLNDPGKPRLPVLHLRIALPDGMRVETVAATGLQLLELDGAYRILPAQPPIEVNDYGDQMEFAQPDPSIYESDKPYPQEIVKFLRQSDLAGQSFAEIEIRPLQYLPASGVLKLATSMELILSGGSGYVCGDYLPENASDRTAAYYRRQLERLIVNDEAVELRGSPSVSKSRVLPDGGPFDHLIITTQSLSGDWMPLADWHCRKGVRDTVITTDYIYANYSGASNQDKIQAFLADAHDNWATLYVLIGGEHSQVPFLYRSYVGESIPSDQYYADIDGDWQMELLVGRVTAADQTEIDRFIAKLLKYETDPPRIGYTLNATILGMDLTTEWDPPYYTLTASEETKELIDTSCIPARFAVTKVYDSDLTNHWSDFVNSLNAGAHLVNHSDHSNTTVMGTGDRNHGWYINRSQVDNLTNDGKMSVIFSLGCHPNEMDYNDCIAEHFVIRNGLQAAVAFTGNTRSGWFYVGDPNSLSAVLDIKWWQGLFTHNMYRLGETLAYSKHQFPNGDSYERYCEWTLNLLGEPEMPVWTDLPIDLVAVHPESVTSNPCEFTVHTQRTHGATVDSALVCLWKAGSVFERGYSDDNGEITFTVSPSSGTLYVTATKQNFIPYTAEVLVDVTNSAPECNAPDDSTAQIRSETEICLPVGCFDPDGNLESGPVIVSGPGEIIEGYWCYTPAGDEVCSVTIRCTDSGGLFCESQFEITVETYVCGDANADDLVNVTDAVHLIGYVFGGQIAPEPLESGDVDCNELVNISDAVYLISYIFGGGEAPCEGC